MAEAKSGDTVKVHYTGKLNDGTVFANSREREPLQFVIGEKRIIPGLEEVVVGMSPGESKTANIPADKGFGPYQDKMVQVVNRSQFPTDLEPKIGEQIQMTDGIGRTTIVTIKEISGSNVTLDTNHLLAGKDLMFDIELIEIL